jgi:effector-binding domain-containing protein
VIHCLGMKKLVISIIFLLILIVAIILVFRNNRLNDTRIKEVTFDETAYIGVIRTLSFEEMKSTELYTEVYEKLESYMRDNRVMPRGAPQNVYFSWNPEDEMTKMGVAFPVKKGIEVDHEEIEYFEIKESKALSKIHKGDYMNLEDSHNELMKFIEENELTMGDIAIEEYLTNPDKTKDTEDYRTRLYYFIVGEEA